MAYAQAQVVDPKTIPLIDLTALRTGADASSVARALHQASQGLGFIYLVGHGIDPANLVAAREQALKFFRSSTELKHTVTVSASHRGWLGHGAARMQDDAKPDLKESFIWGLEQASSAQPKDHSLRGENRWPAFLPELEPVAQSFFKQAHELAHHLMHGFALGLNLPEDFFLGTNDRPLSRASFVYYPAQPEAFGVDQFGVAPHTDFGVLTVLCQDEVGGLQIQNRAGEWIHAPPIENALVVNVGDLLSRWTAGAYPSTPHRVVNQSGKERLSIVLAYDPNPETLIDARQVVGLKGAGAAELAPPITCGDYLTWRFGRAFSYRQEADSENEGNK